MLKFSHKNYHKFRGKPPEQAYLIDLMVVNSIDDVPDEFLDYDVKYNKVERYNLRKDAKYIVLFLFDPKNRNLFTTFRAYSEYRYDYYLKHKNHLFKIIYKDEGE